MSKQHDLRLGNESGRWKPETWSAARRTRFLRNARREAMRAAWLLQDERVRNEVLANVRQYFDLAVSKAAIFEEVGPHRYKELFPNG